MRFSRIFGLLALAMPLFASPMDSPAVEESDATTTTSDVSWGATEAKSTIFNGKDVPPMTELSGETLDEDITHGYWLVEFFSPSCHHCQVLAPILQTLYEFYYTSNPLQSAQESTQNLNSFTRYYDFKFGKVDCVAFGTACSNKEVHSFPSIILFKDGEEQKKLVGVQELEDLSKWVEETLESIRPGSRPAGGPSLPKVGASSIEPSDEAAAKADKGEESATDAEGGEEHKSIVSSATASADEVAATTTKAPSKLKDAPNPHGTSVSLTAEKFQRLVTTTLDPWFVKFYAPWCHHCREMAPNWAEMAREMEGVLNVGEVNCDIEKRLCKDARVKGFPTLLFFRGGERVEYNGLRGVGDLITYAQKATDVGSGVSDVDAASFEKMEETEDVIFVYFYDHATTSEDFATLDRLTLSLIGHAKLVKTKDPKMADRFKISTWPRLMVSRNGKPSYYQYIAPKDMRDFRKVLGWMKTVWQPIVAELTASNAAEIMDGHYVVLGILSQQRSDEFVIAKREIKNAALEWIDKETHARQLERQELRDAKQLRIEEAEDRNDQRALRAAKQIRIDVDAIGRPKVRFAWIDGVFWERWIRTTYGIDVKTGERVVINDEDNRRYWDQTITGNPIVPSRTSILETIPKVIASPPKIAAKSTTSSIERFFFSIRGAWSRHPWIGIGVLLGFVASVIAFSRRWKRHASAWGVSGWGNGGFLHLPLGDEKGGLLGGLSGNGAGKVD